MAPEIEGDVTVSVFGPAFAPKTFQLAECPPDAGGVRGRVCTGCMFHRHTRPRTQLQSRNRIVPSVRDFD